MSNKFQIPDNEMTKWALQKRATLVRTDIETYKNIYIERKREFSKIIHLVDVSRKYFYSGGKEHCHSNFAKWIRSKKGRNGIGNINLLILIVYLKIVDENVLISKRTKNDNTKA